MRNDIATVITERPRRGGPRVITRSYKKKFYDKFDIEEFPNKVSMTRQGSSKDFSDFLTPLRRCIEKYAREGRSYDEVYSEVKKALKGNGTHQRHVLQHFHNYIDLPASDGYMYSKSITGRGYRHQSPYTTEFWETEEGVYVNSEGKLVYNQPVEDKCKKDRRNKKEVPKEIEGKEIVNVDGVWYWIEEKKLLNTVALRSLFKGTYKEKNSGYFGDLYWAKLTRISKKDIKKYSLN